MGFRDFEDSLKKESDISDDDIKDIDQHIKDERYNLCIKIGEKAVDPLENALKSTDDLYKRRKIADTLGKIGGTKVIEILKKLVKDDKEFLVRQATVNILGNIGGEEVIDSIIAALYDIYLDVNYEALIALEKVGSKGSQRAKQIYEKVWSENKKLKRYFLKKNYSRNLDTILNKLGVMKDPDFIKADTYYKEYENLLRLEWHIKKAINLYGENVELVKKSKNKDVITSIIITLSDFVTPNSAIICKIENNKWLFVNEDKNFFNSLEKEYSKFTCSHSSLLSDRKTCYNCGEFICCECAKAIAEETGNTGLLICPNCSLIM